MKEWYEREILINMYKGGSARMEDIPGEADKAEGQDPWVLQAKVPQELLPAAGGGDERHADRRERGG